jgi:hypothetical protein
VVTPSSDPPLLLCVPSHHNNTQHDPFTKSVRERAFTTSTLGNIRGVEVVAVAKHAHPMCHVANPHWWAGLFAPWDPTVHFLTSHNNVYRVAPPAYPTPPHHSPTPPHHHEATAPHHSQTPLPTATNSNYVLINHRHLTSTPPPRPRPQAIHQSITTHTRHPWTFTNRSN